MITISNEQGPSPWFSSLAEIVQEHWNSFGKAFLLANVPNALRKRGIDIQGVLKGAKLKEVIATSDEHDFKLVQNPADKLVWGLVPISASLPQDKAELFSDRERKSMQGPRFSRAVWLAFTMPIEPGKKRYLQFDPTTRFSDFGEDDIVVPNGVEIDQSLIIETSEELDSHPNRDSAIISNITQWAEINDVKLSSLQANSDKKKAKEVRVISNLDISSLSANEKARILIPLDLLEKMQIR